MIIGYDLNDYKEFGIKVPIIIDLKKNPHVLITGKSGSGKSLSARWYLWQMGYLSESRIYISDYKGGQEYEMFEGSSSYASDDKAFDMINAYYQFFTEVRNSKIRLQKHYTLFVEEWFGLLAYAENKSKKLRTQLMNMVGELLAVGRGLNIGVILCVQRPDASLFSNGIREQFQSFVSIGRCSNETFHMLGFNGELDKNPTIQYKAGEALVLSDGQEGLREIVIPWILNQNEMCQQIRTYLDSQPDIPSLIRRIAEGKKSGQ